MNVLDPIYQAFFADPMYYIGILFALWGAWGFGLFVRGLGSGGLRHIFTYSEQQSHVVHARVHAMQGLYMTMTAFGAWELLRVIVGDAPLSYLWISFVMLAPVWLPWAWRGGKPPKTSGGH